LQRKDAIQLLREVISNFPIVMTYVSLIAPNSVDHENCSTGYQLKIGTTLNDASRKGLNLMLRKKRLDMVISKDFVVIYKPQQLTDLTET
jgi:hypothetical protein